MQRCIFNDIVEKKVPAYTVYEDDKYLAFLDIFPHSKGHTLVIPKTQYRWSYEVPDFGEYWETVLTVTRKIQAALQPAWVNYYTHGLIPYAHVHILPRFEEMSEDAPIIPKTDKPNQDEFEAVALKIREAQV